MKKDIYLKDYLASRVISFNKTLESPEYGKIFYECNEDLVDTLKEIEFKEKEVLSVLASSDQVFTARYLKAKKVDAFDKNRLTLYYYYLRLWTIKYRNELYPKVLNNSNWLKILLKEVKPETEMEQRAYHFFQKHIEDKTVLRNLFYDTDMQPIGRTLYQNAKDLKDCLDSKIDFYSFDLFEESKLPKKYDIILISNILEWSRNDQNKLQTAASNLNNLVKKDGIVACSSLIFRKKEQLEKEKEIFSPYFEQEKKEYSYVYHKK